MAEDFWSAIVIPTNPEWRETGEQFVNPIDVQDSFATATFLSSQLHAALEGLTTRAAEVDAEITALQASLKRGRTQVLSRHFDEIKASWEREVLDAFILNRADTDTAAKLQDLSRRIAELTLEGERLHSKIDVIRTRLKALGEHQHWAEQWLNFDKLQQRASSFSR